MGTALPLKEDARRSVSVMADGNGRYLLNLVEEIGAIGADHPLDVVELTQRIQKGHRFTQIPAGALQPYQRVA